MLRTVLLILYMVLGKGPTSLFCMWLQFSQNLLLKTVFLHWMASLSEIICRFSLLMFFDEHNFFILRWFQFIALFCLQLELAFSCHTSEIFVFFWGNGDISYVIFEKLSWSIFWDNIVNGIIWNFLFSNYLLVHSIFIYSKPLLYLLINTNSLFMESCEFFYIQTCYLQIMKILFFLSNPIFFITYFIGLDYAGECWIAMIRTSILVFRRELHGRKS